MHGERAAAGHTRLVLDEVRGAAHGQGTQLLTLDTEGGCVAPIATHHCVAHERFVVGAGVEVAVAAQQQWT